MKQFMTTLAALLLVAGTALNAQVTMENVLTPRQQNLAAIACLEAKGDLGNLATAIDRGLDEGLTVNEIKEALSQLYAYTGFPRSLNALGTLQRVVADRQQAGKPTTEGRDADPLPAGYDALQQGTDVQTRLTGRPFNYDFAPQTDYYLKAHLFGDIFARNNLTHQDRELVTVSALSGIEGVAPQLQAHVRGARNMGVSDAELHAIPQTLDALVGTTEGNRTRAAIAVVYGEQAPAPLFPSDFVWPQGQPNTAYAQYFTGNSYVAPLDAQHGGPVNVTFEPRCRNNWHIHHKAVQVLICVAGHGWYQEWGKPAVEMTPGTVIAIPAETKHWHGAARDTWFQHLTYHANVQEGSSNEWLEPVTDDVYDQLK